MAWTGLTLTVEGRSTLNRAQTDGRLCFKSLVVGDGNPPANFGTQKGLVHKLYELTDIKIDMTADGCALTADFPAVDYDYYFREIGVTVVTEDGEKLYVYDNCGDDAQYIVSSTGAERTQKRIRIYLTISDVADITVSAPSILYVDYDDYEQEIERLGEDINAAKKEMSDALEGHTGNKSNPHAVTKAQIGLGNVNNTSDANKPVSTAQQAALDTKLDKTGDVMSGMLDVVYGSGEVKVFCDNRGGHVWIYNTESKKVLQIVCEEDEGKFYLVDISDTPTCANFMHLTSGSVNTGHDITVGAGAENGRVNFISPSSQRSMWVGFANSNGNFYIWDTTNNKAIISAPKTGVPTFHGHAASDLALTGGSLSGNLTMGNTGLTDSPDIHWLDKFRNIWAGMCNGAGDWYLYDATNQKSIIHSTKAGVSTFYGNAASATKAVQDGNGNNIVNTYQIKTGDAKDNSVTFTSADVADGSATAWTSVAKLSTGEKFSSLLNKISTMFKNIRYLYKMLGTTNISAIGGGTVTGAISKLNTDLSNHRMLYFSGSAGQVAPQRNTANTSDGDCAWTRTGNIVNLMGSAILKNAPKTYDNYVLFTGIPKVYGECRGPVWVDEEYCSAWVAGYDGQTNLQIAIRGVPMNGKRCYFCVTYITSG